MQWITILSNQTEVNAHLTKGFLENHDIPCEIKLDTSVITKGVFTSFIVLVPETFKNKAVTLIKERDLSVPIRESKNTGLFFLLAFLVFISVLIILQVTKHIL